ncbi:MFS transporter [Candidatus Pacearchaeota archaeon]|nr:MFS transporter [Candidatus Pacearchaeota archaeon]
MEFFKKGELKLLWPFYLNVLISPMLFFLPAFMIIYFRDLGFSIFQISLLTMMMPLFMLLFEIPTGAVADIYGRKISVLLGMLIEGVTIFSIFFLNNFYHLMFAFALIGLGSTFSSGAKEAWITDLIRKEKKNFLQNYFVKSRSLSNFGLVVSGILGAFLVKQFGVSIIWIFAGISLFTSIMLLGFAKEHFIKRKVKIKDSFKSLIKQSKVSIRYAKNHHILFLLLIATVLTVFATEFSSSLAWIPLLQNLSFPDYAFGYLWSAIGVIGIFAPLVSLKFLKKGQERKFILNTILLTILVLALVIFVKNIFFAFLIILSQLFLGGMSYPVERNYFHKFIKSKLRATVGSVESMLIGLIGILAMPLAGLSVDYLGPQYTILLSAFLMIPSAVIFFKIKDGK